MQEIMEIEITQIPQNQLDFFFFFNVTKHHSAKCQF